MAALLTTSLACGASTASNAPAASAPPKAAVVRPAAAPALDDELAAVPSTEEAQWPRDWRALLPEDPASVVAIPLAQEGGDWVERFDDLVHRPGRSRPIDVRFIAQLAREEGHPPDAALLLALGFRGESTVHRLLQETAFLRDDPELPAALRSLSQAPAGELRDDLRARYGALLERFDALVQRWQRESPPEPRWVARFLVPATDGDAARAMQARLRQARPFTAEVEGVGTVRHFLLANRRVVFIDRVVESESGAFLVIDGTPAPPPETIGDAARALSELRMGARRLPPVPPPGALRAAADLERWRAFAHARRFFELIAALPTAGAPVWHGARPLLEGWLALGPLDEPAVRWSAAAGSDGLEGRVALEAGPPSRSRVVLPAPAPLGAHAFHVSGWLLATGSEGIGLPALSRSGTRGAPHLLPLQPLASLAQAFDHVPPPWTAAAREGAIDALVLGSADGLGPFALAWASPEHSVPALPSSRPLARGDRQGRLLALRDTEVSPEPIALEAPDERRSLHAHFTIEGRKLRPLTEWTAQEAGRWDVAVDAAGTDLTFAVRPHR